MTRVLVVEDGHEYSTTLSRFLGGAFAFTRAGSGPDALRLLATESFDVAFLDMRFDRVDPGVLLGSMDDALERSNGDAERARRFLEDNQGVFVLSALRDAGHSVPAVFSYDFDGEPRRWRFLAKRYGPLQYLTDNASPDDIRGALERAAGR